MSARHIAERAGAPLVAGTPDPVSGADEVIAFAEQNGLPIAIKAAFGGGGRGLKVARTREEIARATLMEQLNQSFGIITPEMMEVVGGVKTILFGDDEAGAIVAGPPPASVEQAWRSPLEQ